MGTKTFLLATILAISGFFLVVVISPLAQAQHPPRNKKTNVTPPKDKAVVSEPKTEFAMKTGMRIEATNKVGTIVITAVDEYTRSYTWEGATRSAELAPRSKRWYGSLGLYFPGPGDHWKEHSGITRGVLEEGQQHFKTANEALDWIGSRMYMDYVYRDDGLVVGWGKTLPRKQLNVEVWQFMMDGKKPAHLAGSRTDKVKVTHVETETSPLVKAVKKNDLGVVKALLQKGSDPNVKDSVGSPVLVIATKRGHAPIVRALVERKANPNARDEDGSTPLLLTNDIETIKILLDAGADVNLAHSTELMKGFTPLMGAAINGDSEVLELLLKKKAKVDARSEDGMTALMCAAMQGEADCVKVLLKNGANPNARAVTGMSVLRLAQIVEKQEVIKLLKDAGAKE